MPISIAATRKPLPEVRRRARLVGWLVVNPDSRAELPWTTAGARYDSRRGRPWRTSDARRRCGVVSPTQPSRSEGAAVLSGLPFLSWVSEDDDSMPHTPAPSNPPANMPCDGTVGRGCGVNRFPTRRAEDGRARRHSAADRRRRRHDLAPLPPPRRRAASERATTQGRRNTPGRGPFFIYFFGGGTSTARYLRRWLY